MSANAEKKIPPYNAPNNGHAPPSNIFEGVLVSMTGNHLVLTNLEGERCSITLAKDAKLTCDGAVCQTEDLKFGAKLRVTTRQGDRNVAICIEFLNELGKFTEFR